MFHIKIKKLYWIDGSDDDPNDLCLHGDVAVDIGAKHYEESCTVSATALFLLKSLIRDHIIFQNNPMLPCCGHFLIPDEKNETVTILGCSNGIDWSVLRHGNRIIIVTEKGKKTTISPDEYRKSVFAFADTIERYYQNCSPKILSSLDSYARNAYEVFWREWKRLRLNG